MSSSYCSSCKIEVQNDDNLRDHYKSEFHRYNIKRKLVGLPPATADQFSLKKAQLLAESSQSEKDQLIKCEVCSKTFASKATYKQHLESKKHKETLKKFNSNEKDVIEAEEKKQSETSSTNADESGVCLFCNKRSADVDENLVHMRLTHSFFISESKYLKDLKGLLKYLATKIYKKGMCIYCGVAYNKEGRSGESVQKHMLDKGHIFMNTEDFGEYKKFYDFSKVMEEYRSHNLTLDNQAVAEEDEYMEVSVESEDEEEVDVDDDWEVIEDGDGQKERVFKLKRARLLDSGEIQLPNGSILGHRTYKLAYKQHHKDAARQKQMENSALEYRSEKMVAVRREESRLMAFNKQIIRKERKFVGAQAYKILFRKEKEIMRRGLNANKLQRHFRKQEN